MILFYEETNSNLHIFKETSRHTPPHIHKTMECVYVLEGSLELGIGKDFYHMEQGDFAIIFPELIHHYQVFQKGTQAYYMMVSPSLCGSYLCELQKKCPKNPVIKEENLHYDIVYAINMLIHDKSNNMIIKQAFFQIILARSMLYFDLIDKEEMSSDNIVYQVVSYIAKNFKDSISLSKMAKELGISKYVLSRVFSKVFYRNFNQYVNEIRLDYACSLLTYGNETITNVAMNAGFESQRTFNRVFRERFRKSPRDYRKYVKNFSGKEEKEVNQ